MNCCHDTQFQQWSTPEPCLSLIMHTAQEMGQWMYPCMCGFKKKKSTGSDKKRGRGRKKRYKECDDKLWRLFGPFISFTVDLQLMHTTQWSFSVLLFSKTEHVWTYLLTSCSYVGNKPMLLCSPRAGKKVSKVLLVNSTWLLNEQIYWRLKQLDSLFYAFMYHFMSF